MVKYILIFFLFAIAYSQKYDPKTGKLIEEKQVDQKTRKTIEKVEYDPKTGEIIKKDNETVKSLLNKEVMVILISDDTIRGKLLKESNEEIEISSSTIGSINLERKNIKSIIDISNGRAYLDNTSNTAGLSDSKTSDTVLPPNYSQISNEAKKEAKENNNHLSNIILGTGSAVIWPTIPITLYYLQKGKLPEPNSYFYKNLDEESKLTYKKIYEKQYRSTKTIQTVTGPVISCGVFMGSMFILFMFLSG